MINGVVLSKLQVLRETLEELRSLGHVTTGLLAADWRTRRAVERDLQILVEVVIDICHRLLALRGETPAPTSAEAVQRCIGLAILTPHDAYGQMVQFRNFVVHRYERIDVTVLTDIVSNRLDDFDRFAREIAAYAEHLLDPQTWRAALAGFPAVAAAWVFGSQAREGARPDSDLDVGILFAAAPAFDDLLRLRACLQIALRFEAIDLVVLNNASPILRFEAVSGLSVFVHDPDKAAAFVSLTAREYEDETALSQRWLRSPAA